MKKEKLFFKEKYIKKILLFFVCTFFAFISVNIFLNSSNEVNAEVIASGVDTITMTLEDSKFTVQGHGTLTTDFPWKNYSDTITELVFVSTSEEQKIFAPEDSSSMFKGLTLLQKIDLSGLDTSNVTNMHYMFADCINLTELDLSMFDTSNVNDMTAMFCMNSQALEAYVADDDETFDNKEELETEVIADEVEENAKTSALTNINLASFDTTNVYNMNYLFFKCDSLESIDISTFNTRNCVYMAGIFFDCSSLLEIDLSNISTERANDISAMFLGCSSLTSIDVSLFDTTNVIKVSGMFADCTGLTSIDISNFNTSNIDDFSNMFNLCQNVTQITLPNNFVTSSAVSMSGIFYYCKSLTSINSSDWNTSNVEFMDYMFMGCQALTELNVSSFNTSNVTEMNFMFGGTGLSTLDISNFDTSKVDDMEAMFGQFPGSDCSFRSITIDKEKFKTNLVTSMRGMFAWNTALVNLDVSGFNTSNVTDMSNMFIGCQALTTIDVSNFDTTNVTDMGYMFAGVGATSLDLSNFNTAKVENMEFMFSQAKTTILDLSTFNTSKVTNMQYMFEGAATATITFGDNFDTSNVTNMDFIFRNCTNLTALNLSTFNTSKITNMLGMFYGCTSLQSITFSNLFDTSNVSDMSYMFCGCANLNELDLSMFNTSNVTTMEAMFSTCKKLTSVKLQSFVTPKLTNMASMFFECYLLQEIDLSSFDFTNVASMWAMCGNDYSLTSIKFNSTLSTLNLTNIEYLFYSCTKLTMVDFSAFELKNVTSASNVFNNSAVNKIILPKSVPSVDVALADTIFYPFDKTGKILSSSPSYTLIAAPTELAYLEKVTTNIQYIYNDTILTVYGHGFLDTTFPWKTYEGTFTEIKFITSAEDKKIYAPSSCSGMFSDMDTLVKIDFSGLDTANVTSMGLMFKNCSNLTTLDVSNFDTSNVTSMSSMFHGVPVTTLDISNFNTSNVKLMDWMFANCSNLTSLNLNGVNTSKVTTMTGMFANCKKLSSLNLTGFDTTNVETMKRMFSDCCSLTTLNVSSFNTEKVTNMECMFGAYDSIMSLTSLDLSNFNTENVTNMADMFRNCAKLESIKVNSFNTENVEDMERMFMNCNSLEELDLSSFDMINVTNAENMLYSIPYTTYLHYSKLEMAEFLGVSVSEITDDYDLSSIGLPNITLKETVMQYYKEEFSDGGILTLKTPKNCKVELALNKTMYDLDTKENFTNHPMNENYSRTLSTIFVRFYDNKEKDCMLACTTVGYNTNAYYDDSKYDLWYDCETSQLNALTNIKEEQNVYGKINFTDVTVEGILNKIYTGYELEQDMIVKKGEDTLTSGANYKVSYADNIDAGTATITLEGLDEYVGNVTKTFDIAKKLLTYTATANDKVYDGTTAATISITNLVGVVDGDTVSVEESIAGTFISPNAGTNIEVTTTEVPMLSGIDANNYYVEVTTNEMSADITKEQLVESMIDTLSSEIYTGSEIEKTIVLDGVDISNYDVEYSNNVNVGTAIVTITAKNNYSGTLTRIFAITPYEVTIDLDDYLTNLKDEKVYDAKTILSGDKTLIASGVNGETITITLSGEYADKNVGSNKEIIFESTPKTSKVTGGNGSIDNYKLTITNLNQNVGTITKKLLTYTGVAQDKVYDGTTDAIINITNLEGVIDDDDVQIEETIGGEFASSEKGTGIIVTTSEIPTLSGDNANNYYVNSITQRMTANISSELLKESMIGDLEDEVYTGNAITKNIILDGVDSSDYTIKYTNNVNAGVATVTINGKNNYAGTLTRTFKIIPKDINVDLSNYISGITKVYDGNEITYFEESQTKEIQVNGVNGEIINIKISGTYDNKNVGVNKTVTLTNSSSSVTGGNKEVDNYNVIFTNIETTGSIETKELTYTGVAQDKVYDGTTDAIINITNLQGVINDDDVQIEANINGKFVTSNVGTNIKVTTENIPLLSGNDFANYKVLAPANEMFANITKLTFGENTTISAIEDKMYTGLEIKPNIIVKNNNKELTLNTDYEVVYTNNKNVGTAKVTIRGIGDYSGTKEATFEIIPKTIALEEIILSNVLPVVKERDGIANVTSSLLISYTNSNNNEKVKVTYKSAVYTKEGNEVVKADNDENKYLDITLEEMKISNTNYLLEETTKTFSNAGRIIDTTSPKVISITSIPGSYTKDNEVKIILNFDEEVILESSAEVRLVIKGKSGSKLSNLEEKEIIYQNIQEKFEKTKEFIYKVSNGDIALNGLEIVEVKIVNAGFKDEYENIMNPSINLKNVVKELDKTYIDAANELKIEAYSPNMITLNQIKETKDLEITIKFIFENEIANNSFTKDDILINVDGISAINKPGVTIGELIVQDNKNYTLALNLTESSNDQEVLVSVPSSISEDINECINLSSDLKVIIKGKDAETEERPETSKPSKPSKPISNSNVTVGFGSSENSLSNKLEEIKNQKIDRTKKKYMKGFNDSTFRPNDLITRAEVAAILARISKDYEETKKYDMQLNYFDVRENTWASNYIGYVKNEGIILGNDGYFRPNDSITRAEFATAIARMIKVEGQELKTNKFLDVVNRWYEKDVNLLSSLGYIEGYPDNTFGGNKEITRAEACKIINKVMGSSIDEESKEQKAKEILKKFKDVNKDSWYFKEILDAIY